MHAVGTALGVVAVVALGLLGAVVLAFATYLLVLALAAFRYSTPEVPAAPSARLVVLVPAHNEADLIERCVTSLLDQRYPSDNYELVVIADNCTDDTARLARARGAGVLVRTDPEKRGKGPALRWAMDLILQRDTPPDAII